MIRLELNNEEIKELKKSVIRRRAKLYNEAEEYSKKKSPSKIEHYYFKKHIKDNIYTIKKVERKLDTVIEKMKYGDIA